MKKWPKGSNHHQVLETALMGASSGKLVMDRIFEWMSRCDPDWPVARSVAPEGWYYQMPFVPEDGSPGMGMRRERPAPQAAPRDSIPPTASQYGQSQGDQARNH